MGWGALLNRRRLVENLLTETVTVHVASNDVLSGRLLTVF